MALATKKKLKQHIVYSTGDSGAPPKCTLQVLDHKLPFLLFKHYHSHL